MFVMIESLLEINFIKKFIFFGWKKASVTSIICAKFLPTERLHNVAYKKLKYNVTEALIEAWNRAIFLHETEVPSAFILHSYGAFD